MAIRYHIRKSGREVDLRAVNDKMSEDVIDNGHPMAEVAFNRPREDPNFDDSKVSYQYQYTHPDSTSTPTELFTHVPPHIAIAYSDPSMIHTMPTMVGIGMRAVGAEHEVPMADYDLSAYSSRLSRHAVRRGLAVPHFSNKEMRYKYQFGDSEPTVSRSDMPEHRTWTVDPEGWDQVPSEEVAAGRQWVRSRIRGDQKPKKQIKRGDSQFEQLNLGI